MHKRPYCNLPVQSWKLIFPLNKAKKDLIKEKLRKEVSPFGFCSQPEWLNTGKSITQEDYRMDKYIYDEKTGTAQENRLIPNWFTMERTRSTGRKRQSVLRVFFRAKSYGIGLTGASDEPLSFCWKQLCVNSCQKRGWQAWNSGNILTAEQWRKRRLSDWANQVACAAKRRWQAVPVGYFDIYFKEKDEKKTAVN